MQKRVLSAVLCAFSILTPALTPAVAQTSTEQKASRASSSSEADALKAQIQTLQAQKTAEGANVAEIDASIAKLQARLAKLEAAKKGRAAAVAPDGSTVPEPESGGVATKTTINRDVLQSSNAQNTYDAVKDVPGVAQADAKAGGGADNLQIRGIHLTSETGYRLDGGLPMANNVAMPTEDKERVQVLKGAGALEYGIASPAGIINYVLKRATKNPINELSFSGNGFGQAITSIDVGRKFGSIDQFGVRMNLAGGETGGYARDTGGTRWLGAMTADWTTRKASLRVGYEQFGINIVENASILQNKAGTNGTITLPRIPDPSNLLSGTWDRSVGLGRNAQLQATIRPSDAFTILAEVGRSDTYRPHRIVSQIGAYNIVTGKGTETSTLIQDQRYINSYANLAASFRSQHGDHLTNTLTVGYTNNDRYTNNPVNPQVTNKQNIYNPVMLPGPTFPTGPLQYQPQLNKDYDYYFMNALVLAQRIHITGGLREIHYSADNVGGGTVNHTSTSFLAPAAGIVLDMTRNVSLYASYVKSLEQGGSAPINSKNAFAVLPAAPSTQREAGIRAFGSNGLSATLAYFYINRANATTDPITNIYALNGTNTFQGFEGTFAVRIAPRLTLGLGGQLMHAVENSPNDKSIDGKIPENTPKRSGTIGLAYQPRFARGMQLSAGLQSLSARQINPQDQGTIPGVTLVNAGMTLNKRIGDKRVSFNLNCRNCTDKRYWSSAVNGALGIGVPRTISFSARFAPSP